MVKTKNRQPLFLWLAYSAMLITIFLLPYFSFEGYSILSNTTSHLGAQDTPNAWIMNSTFILLGLASIAEGFKTLKPYPFHKVSIFIFGLALILTAIFQHSPVSGSTFHDVHQDKLHSIFATLTGFAFTVFAISTEFILADKKDKILALVVALVAIIIPILMLNYPDYAGLWQRFMFIAAFGWLIHLFSFYR